MSTVDVVGSSTEVGRLSSSSHTSASTTPRPSQHDEQQLKPTRRDPCQANAATVIDADAQADRKSKRRVTGRVQVLVRCRPLIPNEDGHTATRIHTTSNAVVVNDASTGGDARQFTFDTVLPPDADQATAFAEVEPLIDHVLDGFHATVFAYGQTGSGKTHTMEGLSYIRRNAGKRKRWESPPAPQDLLSTPGTSSSAVVGEVAVADVNTAVEEHGIMPRAIQLLFDRARLRQGSEVAMSPTGEPDESSVQYSFRCSYYQIYNEVITDLLRAAPRSSGPGSSSSSNANSGLGGGGGLKVRWQKNNTFRVQNLFLCECESAEQMRSALFAGVQQKVMSSHLMNDQSSRSHCVFTVYVDCRKVKSGDLLSRSEFSMVDLAGSEKLGLLASNPTAKLVKESIDINTSLLALGKVITALALNSQKNARLNSKRDKTGLPRKKHPSIVAAAAAGHVPYRDSKLTMLLKHALGGNSFTMMIACISPSDRYVEETVSTLLYAGRASNIENVPHVNEDPTAVLIKQLREEIRQLKQELQHYRSLAANGLLTASRGELSGAGDATNKETTTVLASQALTALGATQVEGESSAKWQQQSDSLADSLLAACEMLQGVLSANAQLRDAYDVVREAKEAADVREVQLNAENLALRERIQSLESIVLDKTLANDVLEADAEDEQDGEDQTSTVSGAERAVDAEKPVSERAPPARRVIDWSKRSAKGAPKDPVVNAEKLEDLVEPASAPAAVETVGQPTNKRPGKSEKKKERKTQRRRRKLAKRLEAYEAKYHGAEHVGGRTEEGTASTYASYYGRAAKAAHKEGRGRSKRDARGSPAGESGGGVDSEAADAAASLSPLNVRRQLLSARSDMQHVVSSTVVEVQKLMKRLPDPVLAEFIPQSLKHSRSYGMLSFCGGAEANAAGFEAKRQDREARRQALLRRQQELLKTVHTDIVERRFYQPATPSQQLPLSHTQQRGLEHAPAVNDKEDGNDDDDDGDAYFGPPRFTSPTPSETNTARKVGSSRGAVTVLSLSNREGGTSAAPRVSTVASPPRWETGASLELIQAQRMQEQQEQRRGSSTAAIYGSPYSTGQSTSRIGLQASAFRPDFAAPSKRSKNSEKLSSMDKLLIYLREQGH